MCDNEAIDYWRSKVMRFSLPDPSRTSRNLRHPRVYSESLLRLRRDRQAHLVVAGSGFGPRRD